MDAPAIENDLSPDDRLQDVPVDEPSGADGSRRWRSVAAWVTTALACMLVLFALSAPNQITQFTPAAVVRIPLEGVLAVPLLLLLPSRARRWAAIAVGVIFGLLAIAKVFDLGFFAVLDRPFEPVFDWTFLGPGVDFLTSSIGRPGAIAVVIAIAGLAVAVVVFMTLSVLRLTRIMARRRTVTIRAAGVLAVAWVACAVLGTQFVPGLPVAAESYDRLAQIRSSLQDGKVFAASAAVDAFHRTPGSQFLTALRGKDVIFTFVESYGRVAAGDPAVQAVLDDGTRRLSAAGYGSRTAYLTSPTAGGGSWLAHSTLLSGLWVDNQQRYDSLVKTNRLTLTNAFKRAGWRTVAVMPGTTQDWPEASFYGYDRLYDRWTMGYKGPRFNWGMPPDQYTLSAFQHAERTPGHAPVMAEIPLVTSHAPWAPTPRMIDWAKVGDGSAFDGMPATGQQPFQAWSSPARVRAAYMGSIEYSLDALVSYVETYGDNNLVLVFLGDHQPAPIITGEGASHDVPITIVARDPAVLNRISGWGWQAGLKPSSKAPVWRMDTFRDRFLTAFGSQPAR